MRNQGAPVGCAPVTHYALRVTGFRIGVSMPVEITMPQLSDTMTEGTVVKWHKKEGDKVRAGEELVEVETDKATMPFEAAESGTLAHVAVQEGQKVPVGAVIAVLATAKENPADVKKNAGARAGARAEAGAGGGTGAKSAGQKTAVATARGDQGPADVSARRAATANREAAQRPAASGSARTMEGASAGEMHEPEDVGHGATREAATAVPPLQGGGGDGNGERVFASPLARRVAADRNIDLSQL